MEIKGTQGGRKSKKDYTYFLVGLFVSERERERERERKREKEEKNKRARESS